VWRALSRVGKAFDVGALTGKALLHNMDSRDYGRPLDEFRDLFWSSPRLPLLPGGDSDLQRAIFEAVAGGQLRLVGADGQDRAVTRAGDIAVGSSGLRLVAPAPVTPAAPPEGTPGQGAGSPAGTTPAGGGQVPPPAAGSGGLQPGGGAFGGTAPAANEERELAFTLISSMSDAETRDAVRRLFMRLSEATDDGSITWAQLQLRVIVDAKEAAAIEQDAREAGTNPTSKPA